MTKRTFYIVLKILFFSFVLLIVLPTWATRPTCVTSRCHSQTQVGKSVHGPSRAKGCTVCHQLDKNKKHKIKKHPGLVEIQTGEINALCFTCHDEFEATLKASHQVHSAIKKKSCASCHDSHSSAQTHLLKNSAKECSSCHKKVKTQFWTHDPVNKKKKCLNCHTTHSSQHAGLLVKKQSELCLTCHSKNSTDIGQLLKNKPVHHTPIKKGKCTKCHSPHGAKHPNLLEHSYSDLFFTKNFDPKDFDHCFKCHDPAMIEQQRTDQITKFRNGSFNLHFLHVKGTDRTRTCRLCHNVHASQRQNLIRDFFIDKDREIPIRYEKTVSGGRCVTMCHKELTYDRQKAVNNETDR